MNGRLLKKQLQEFGITVHPNMICVVQYLEGQIREARTIKAESVIDVLAYLQENNCKNFTLYRIMGAFVRFDCW